MLRNYLLVAIRNINRQRGYAVINVIGLATGIACCLLIGLFVRHELAYDRHHEHGDRIVRVTTAFSDIAFTVTASVVAPALKRDAPEVEEATRIYDSGIFGPSVVRYEDRMFEEERLFYADSTVFRVFTLPLRLGDPARALNRPSTVVLTHETAQKYFGDADPRGLTLQVNQSEYEVTGVLEPLPTTSHLQFDILASFSSLGPWAHHEVWTGGANFLTYLLLRDRDARQTLPSTIDRLLAQAEAADIVPAGFGLPLEPLHEIHLDVGGRRAYVYLFSAIGLLILLIACVNYMNLATARAAERAREVGIRKVNGARRQELVAQFYGESGVMALLSLALAAGIVYVLAPAFERISGQSLGFSLGDPFVIGFLVVTALLATLVAGSYPALRLSSFEPVRALRGRLRGDRGAAALRRGLVTFQFAVSIFLLVGTAVILSQLRYLHTTDLGFRGEQVVALPIGDAATMQSLPSVKQRIMDQPGVLATAAIDRLPGMPPGGYSLLAEGWEVPDGMDYFPMHAIPTEAGVVETLGLDLVAGSDFRVSADYLPQAGDYQYLINEAVLRATGWTPEEAVGMRMSVSGDNRWGTVVGVIRDYHYLPLREAVGPLALFAQPNHANNLLVRIMPADVPATLGHLEAIWREHVPHRPFTYTFLDDSFATHYADERRLGGLVGSAALVAMLIAGLGLFALAAYAAERRRKEIGVRKVLGAPVHRIIFMLSREFALLIALAFILSGPAAYAFMGRWLDGFAYRIEIGPGIFILVAGFTLTIAFLTVSYQAIRAATADPAPVLQSE
jgi:putative ABC transport system permease protein